MDHTNKSSIALFLMFFIVMLPLNTALALKIDNVVLTGATEDSISIAWDPLNDSNTTGYNIFRNSVLLDNVSNEALAYTDTTAEQDNVYFYQVSGLSSETGESDKSDPLFASVTPPDTQPPQVVDLVIDKGDIVKVSWTTDEPATTTFSWGTTAALGTNIPGATLTTNHEAVLSGLQELQEYFFRIEACDAENNCQFSPIQSFIFGSDETPPPLDFEIPSLTNKNTIPLSGITEAGAFVQVFANGNLRGTIEEVGAEGIFAFSSVGLVTSAPSNTIRVISRDVFGNTATLEKTIGVDITPPVVELSGFEDLAERDEITVNGTVNEEATVHFYVFLKEQADELEPPRITGLTAEAKDGFVELTWDRSPATDFNRYLVYRDDIGLIDQVSSERFSDDNIDDQTTYMYFVSATDKLCNEGLKSESVSVTTLGTDRTRNPPSVDEFICQGLGHQKIEVNGSFEHQLSLKSGNNIIKVQVIDKAGNVFEQNFGVLSDDNPPDFKELNLDAITPSYLCEETIQGELDGPATIDIYLNGATKPVATVQTDESHRFSAKVKFSRDPSIQIEADGIDNANDQNTQTQIRAEQQKWNNKVRIVATDAAGNNATEQGSVMCALCGEGSDWKIHVGDVMPNEVVPRYILDGIGQVGFVYNITWNGIGDPPTIHDVKMDFYPLSDEDQNKFDADWVRKPMRVIKGNDPRIGYIEVPFRRINPIPGDDNSTRTTFERERNISLNNVEECTASAVSSGVTGCIRLPLMMTLEYGKSGVQKQCWNTEVILSTPVLNPDSIPKGFLNASITAIDSIIDAIDKTLEIVAPVTKYTLIACLGLFVVTWLQYFSEYLSCSGVADPGKCNCDDSGCDTDACTSCYEAKKKSKSAEKLQHYICDRIFCPAAPTFDSYVEQQVKAKNKESNCLKYSTPVNYDRADSGDECGDNAVPPFSGNEATCCEEEYMERWDSSIILMDEFDKSKCLKNPQAEGCSAAGELFDSIADFSFCSNDKGREIQFVSGPVSTGTKDKPKSEQKSFVVDTKRGMVWYGEASKVGQIDPKTGKLTSVQDYVNTLESDTPVFTKAQCSLKLEEKKKKVPERVLSLICPQDKNRKYVADPTSGLLRSIQAVCLSAITNYLRHYKTVLQIIKNCFEKIMLTGDGSAGQCREVLSVYICDIIYYLISCVQEPAGEGYGGNYEGVTGVFKAMGGATAKIKSGIQGRYGNSNLFQAMFVQRKLINSLCAAAFTGDFDLNWEVLIEEATRIPIKSTVFVAPATRRFISFNPVNGHTTHIYNVGVGVVAGADMQYNVDLVCSNTGGCNEFQGGRCDCAGAEEKVLRVTSRFGTGQLDLGQTLDAAPHIEVKAENQAYSNVRYDKVRVTYEYKNNQGETKKETVEKYINQVGGAPPNKCQFHFPSGFLCSFLTDADGVAYFIEWPEVVYDNAALDKEGGFRKVGERVVVRTQVGSLPPSDPTKAAQVRKFARVRVKNQLGSLVHDSFYPISEVTSDKKRLVPESSFTIQKEHFGQITGKKAVCRTRPVDTNAKQLSVRKAESTSGSPQLVKVSFRDAKYFACPAQKVQTGSGTSPIITYKCIDGAQEQEVKKDGVTGQLRFGSVLITPISNRAPEPGSSIALECDAVQTTSTDACPDNAVWKVQVSLHTGTTTGNMSLTPEYYNGKAQDSGELNLRTKCGTGQTIFSCSANSLTLDTCMCADKNASSGTPNFAQCGPGNMCCQSGDVKGCRTDGKDCAGVPIPIAQREAAKQNAAAKNTTPQKTDTTTKTTTTTTTTQQSTIPGCTPIAIRQSKISYSQFAEWYGKIEFPPGPRKGTQPSSTEIPSRLKEVNFRGKSIQIHELLAPLFPCVNAEIEKTCSDADKAYKWTYGRGFRPVNTYNYGISKHTMGIAFDINSLENPYCRGRPGVDHPKAVNICKSGETPEKDYCCLKRATSPEQNVVHKVPKCWIDAFQKYGFLWGGEVLWTKFETTTSPWGRDNMHFNFYGDPTTIGKGVPDDDPHAGDDGPAPDVSTFTGFKDKYKGYPDHKTSSIASCPAGANDCIVDFAYNDAKLLKPGQSLGGRLWVPAEARTGGSVPLIVMLHGVSSSLPQHRLMGHYVDVPSVANGLIANNIMKPVIIAAPSQTAHAGSSSTLWQSSEFDLEEFINTVQAQLAVNGVGVSVDKAHISVFGHSGAGCGIGGQGLYRVAKQAKALAAKGIKIDVLGLMDICFGGSTRAAIVKDALEGTSTKVHGIWVQPEVWKSHRHIDAFRDHLGITSDFTCDTSRYKSCKRNAEEWRFYEAHKSPLDSMFSTMTAHYGAVLWSVEDAFKLYYKK